MSGHTWLKHNITLVALMAIRQIIIHDLGLRVEIHMKSKWTFIKIRIISISILPGSSLHLYRLGHKVLGMIAPQTFQYLSALYLACNMLWSNVQIYIYHPPSELIQHSPLLGSSLGRWSAMSSTITISSLETISSDVTKLFNFRGPSWPVVIEWALGKLGPGQLGPDGAVADI